MGPIGCTETPVRNHQYTRRNIPEECSFITSSEKKNAYCERYRSCLFGSSSGRFQKRSSSNPVQIVSGFRAGLIMAFCDFPSSLIAKVILFISTDELCL